MDRAALDIAVERGLPCGGWCPAGRRAEDGPIDPRYPLRETPCADPAQRTGWNVRDADATLLLIGGVSPGTDLTARVARELGRPVYRWPLMGSHADPNAFRRWLQVYRVRTLNVAGPRESEAPGAYAAAREYLHAVLP